MYDNCIHYCAILIEKSCRRNVLLVARFSRTLYYESVAIISKAIVEFIVFSRDATYQFPCFIVLLFLPEPKTFYLQRGDKAMVLCFVEFTDAKCAVTAMDSLQG